MGGAYTAKPLAAAPGIPPGWNPVWPHPGSSGIYPPGYEPEYSLVMTSPIAVNFDAIASITGSLRDQETYATQEPEDTAIIWTASIGGETVKLRFSGGTNYYSSISSTCVFGTYWGATLDIEFELVEENQGETIILTGVSVISGEVVSQTAEIEISVAIAKVIITFTASATDLGDASWVAEVDLVEGDDTPNLYNYARMEVNKNLPNSRWLVNGEDDADALTEMTFGPYAEFTGSGFTDVAEVTWSESGSIVFTVRTHGNYALGLFVFTDGYNDSAIVANAKFYDLEDNLLGEYDATATVNVGWSTYWLEFNTQTGEISETPVL